MTVETFALAAAALAATSAFIVGARKVVAEFAAAARRQYKIDQLLHRELSDDGNGSLKSQVVRQGERQARQDAKIDHVQDTLDSHVDDLDSHSSNPSAHK